MQRILIGEDSSMMRSLLASSLEDMDAPLKIAEAESGLEARRFLPRVSFGLVVTGINMSDIKGLEWVSFIKNNEKYAPIPFAIVSIEGADREKYLGLGVDADFVKPVDPETLRQAEGDLLASRPSAG